MTNTYADFKKRSAERQHRFIDTKMGSIAIDSPDRLKVQGRTIGLHHDALTDLAEMFRMNKGFRSHLDGTVGEGGKISLMDSLRAAMSATPSGGKEISLAVDPEGNLVRNIGYKRPRLSIEGFFEMVDTVAGRHGLTPVKFSRYGSQMFVTMQHEGRQVKILEDANEVFKSGITFRLDMGCFTYDGWLKRLICSNGMSAPIASSSGELALLSQRAVSDFYDWMRDFAEEQHFIPRRFVERVDLARKIPASFAEAQHAVNTIAAYRDGGADPLLVRHLNLGSVKNDYARIGIDVGELSHMQKRGAETPFSVWDVVNTMTWFASHPLEIRQAGYNMQPRAAMELQVKAGSLLYKRELDMQRRIKSPYEGS